MRAKTSATVVVLEIMQQARLVLMVAMAALTSLGTTSPRYIIQQAMYLPWRGSHLTNIEAGSKTDIVISATESCSW